MGPFEPPVEYLRDCSATSLRLFEVSKLEHVANLRRELRALWEEMLEEAALAHLARWMIEHRADLRTTSHSIEPTLASLGEPPPCAMSSNMSCAEPAEYDISGAVRESAAPRAVARGRVVMSAGKRSAAARKQDSRSSAA